MGILDFVKERKSKEEYKKDVQKSLDVFLSQREAIQGIKDKEGYLEIKNYLQRGVEVCENYLDSTNESVEWHRKQERRTAYREMLKFLENLEKAQS